MEAQQQEQRQRRKLPRWVRLVAIILMLLFFTIGGAIWIWGVRNDLEKVMTAIFVVSGVVCAFLTMPFFSSSSYSAPSKANTNTSTQPPTINFTPNITVSPHITVSPNQNVSSQPFQTETKASRGEVERTQPMDPIGNNSSARSISIHKNGNLEPRLSSSDSVFLVNIPLTDPNEFFGRVPQRTRLLNRARKGACTSIVGPRRIGKTWLISYLRLVASTQLGTNFSIGFIDATMPSCATATGFTTEALKVLGFPLLSVFSNPNLTTLEGFVKDMIAKQKVLILCIDEFEGFATHPQEFDFNFFTGLRAITQAGLGLVVASKDPLIDIVSENTKTSPFFNVFLQLKLEPLDAEDAGKFAQLKSAQAGFTDQERAYLLKFGQRGEQLWPPLRLQLVGEMLLEDKNLATRDGPHNYRPDDPDYWLKFKERLEETYQGMVKR